MLVLWVIGIIFCIIQVSIIYYISIGEVIPNIVIALVIYISLFEPKTAHFYAFFMGLIIDLYSKIFGINTLIYTVIAQGIAAREHKFYKEKPILWLFLLFITSNIHQIIIYAIQKELTLYFLFRYIMPTGIYTTIVGIIIFYILRKVNKREKGRNIFYHGNDKRI